MATRLDDLLDRSNRAHVADALAGIDRASARLARLEAALRPAVERLPKIAEETSRTLAESRALVEKMQADARALHDTSRAADTATRWVDPPAAMLRALLMGTFEARGGFAAVVGPEDPVRADLALRLELLDLEQRFATPERSVGVLRVRATLLDPRDRSAVAQRDFAYRVPAPSADASGGVAAERKAARAFAGDLVRWVETRLPAQPGTPSRSSR